MRRVVDVTRRILDCQNMDRLSKLFAVLAAPIVTAIGTVLITGLADINKTIHEDHLTIEYTIKPKLTELQTEMHEFKALETNGHEVMAIIGTKLAVQEHDIQDLHNWIKNYGVPQANTARSRKAD